MTDTERAVVEAAEAWADCPNVGNRINLECAVRAHRAAPPAYEITGKQFCDAAWKAYQDGMKAARAAKDSGKMVRCSVWSSCYAKEDCHLGEPHNPRHDTPNCYRPEPVEEDQTISTVLDRLSKMPKADFDKALAEHRNGFYARLVDGGIVPEREVRRREREAFERGHSYCNFSAGPFTNPKGEAAKRYPDEEPQVDCTREDPDNALDNEPDTQHGTVNVDAGPSMESRVAELDGKEKAHWARLNDFDRRVTELERLVVNLPTYKSDLEALTRDLHTLENAHITLGGIVTDEIKKWAKK